MAAINSASASTPLAPQISIFHWKCSRRLNKKKKKGGGGRKRINKKGKKGCKTWAVEDEEG